MAERAGVKIVSAALPQDDVLWQSLRDGRNSRVLQPGDMGRIIHAESVLPASEQPLTVGVTDPLIPENNAVFRLTEKGAERSDASAQLVIGVDALLPLVTGLISPGMLAEQGKLQVNDPAAQAVAEQAFGRARPPFIYELY